MSLVATARPARISWYIGYTVLCAVFGAWGAWDYWVRIPHEEVEFAEFAALKERIEALETQAQNMSTPLTLDQVATYEKLKLEWRKYAAGTPEPVPVYDRPLQLYLYVIGCGVLGTPYFIYLLAGLRKRRAELADNGDLTVDGKMITAGEISGIDMSRWMSKSIATVSGTGGKSLAIDDYMLKDAHLIVGKLAHHYHPTEWNVDATKVKTDSDEPTPAVPFGTGGDGEPV